MFYADWTSMQACRHYWLDYVPHTDSALVAELCIEVLKITRRPVGKGLRPGVWASREALPAGSFHRKIEVILSASIPKPGPSL